MRTRTTHVFRFSAMGLAAAVAVAGVPGMSAKEGPVQPEVQAVSAISARGDLGSVATEGADQREDRLLQAEMRSRADFGLISDETTVRERWANFPVGQWGLHLSPEEDADVAERAGWPAEVAALADDLRAELGTRFGTIYTDQARRRIVVKLRNPSADGALVRRRAEGRSIAEELEVVGADFSEIELKPVLGDR